jgi:Ran GTPase-activating protein (RanGAP) involved in mRNA processing and transport
LANVFELEKLDLSATGIGNEGIRDLLAQDPKRLVRLKLQDLKLSFNSNMTDESLSLLATHMPSLKTLDIRYCEIEKNDFKEIFRQLTRNGTKVEGGG